MIIQKIPIEKWESLKYENVDHKRAVIDQVLAQKINDIITELNLDKPVAKYIKLTKGQYAIVDADDYEWLSQWGWVCSATGYATRLQTIGINKRKAVWMHREIMKTPPDMFVDHINHNPLDNRKSNLRNVTRLQNNQHARIKKNNKSGYIGVCWDKTNKKWRVQINIDKKKKTVGYYLDVLEAAKAYNEAAIKYHGDYAVLNSIEELGLDKGCNCLDCLKRKEWNRMLKDIKPDSELGKASLDTLNSFYNTGRIIGVSKKSQSGAEDVTERKYYKDYESDQLNKK